MGTSRCSTGATFTSGSGGGGASFLPQPRDAASSPARNGTPKTVVLMILTPVPGRGGGPSSLPGDAHQAHCFGGVVLDDQRARLVELDLGGGREVSRVALAGLVDLHDHHRHVVAGLVGFLGPGHARADV